MNFPHEPVLLAVLPIVPKIGRLRVPLVGLLALNLLLLKVKKQPKGLFIQPVVKKTSFS